MLVKNQVDVIIVGRIKANHLRLKSKWGYWITVWTEDLQIEQVVRW